MRSVRPNRHLLARLGPDPAHMDAVLHLPLVGRRNKGEMEKGALRVQSPLFGKYVRLRPTLPHRHQCSTIGAEGLSFRVRNGTGRFPFAMAAVTLSSGSRQVTNKVCCLVCGFPTVSREPHSGRVASLYQVIGLLVPVSSTHYCASTSGLSTQ